MTCGGLLPITEVDVFDFSLSEDDLQKLDALTTPEVVQEAQGANVGWNAVGSHPSLEWEYSMTVYDRYRLSPG